MPFPDRGGVATAQWQLAFLEVSGGRHQELGVVVQEPDGLVALATEKPPNPPGPMLVVHVKLLDLFAADRTSLVLHET